MKHLKSYSLFESATGLTQDQIDWLDKCTKEGTWNFNQSTGLVDADAIFYCREQELVDFKGVRFGVVTGDFYCSDNELTSLEGAPQVVGGDFDCSDNKLKSLVGAPQKVEGSFDCSFNKLTSLEGAPQEVEGNFDCYGNQLTSLVGAPPEVGGSFYCYDNQLTSLEGAPQEVEWNFYCEDNPVSEKTLKLIFSKMQSGVSYPIALAASKKEIPQEDWDLLDKTGLTPDLEKGGSVLGRFGVFDS